MEISTIRNFTSSTISNVTGQSWDIIECSHTVELNSRDWEQVFSRLEAALDITTDMLREDGGSCSLSFLTQRVQAKLRG